MGYKVGIIIMIPLFCTNLFASTSGGGVHIGNGGDTIAEAPVSVKELEKLIPSTKLFILSWLQRIELRMDAKLTSRSEASKKSSVPEEVKKLFYSDKDIYEILRKASIVFKINTYCPTAHRDHSDGSVISINPEVICISGHSLAQKLFQSNAKVQLEALILHEVTHLVGTNEKEAHDLQQRYIQDMRFVLYSDLRGAYLSKLEILKSVLVLTDRMKTEAGNRYAFCDAADRVSSLIEQLEKRPYLEPIYILSANDRSQIEELSLWTKSLFDWSTCYPALYPDAVLTDKLAFVEGKIKHLMQELNGRSRSKFSNIIPD